MTGDKKIIIEYPSWNDDARELRKGGKSSVELADYYGVTPARMSQITSENWRSYMVMFKGYSQADRKKGKKLADFTKDLNKYEFVSRPEPSPLERERARNLQKRHYTPLPKEEPAVAKEREFEAARKVVEGKHLIGAKIKCSKCQTTAEYFNNSGSVTPNHLPKEFTRLGWFVGKNSRTDLCPEHAAPIRSPRKEETVPATSDAVVFSQKALQTMTAPAPSIAVAPKVPATSAWPKTEALPRIPTQPAGAPAAIVPPAAEVKPEPVNAGIDGVTVKPPAAELGRTERRIIFAKLNDVYGDETKGYSGDWNDAKVASDLGVPVEWVAQVREADFGPETNENIRAVQHAELLKMKEDIERLIVLLDKKIEIAQDLDSKVKSALTAMDAAIDRAEQLKDNIATEDKRMEELLSQFDENVEEFKKKFSQLNRSPS